MARTVAARVEVAMEAVAGQAAKVAGGMVVEGVAVVPMVVAA